MLKKLLFIHKIFPYSGAERVTLDVCNALTERGFSVTVMTPEHQTNRYPAECPRLFDVVEMPKCNLKSSGTAERYICEYIQSNGIEVIVSYRELLYIQRIKQVTNVKFVYVLHNRVGYEYIGSNPILEAINNWIYRYKYKRIFKHCDVYGVLCPQYRDEIRHTVGKTLYEDDKVAILPNPIPQVASLHAAKREEVIYVGRLSHRDKRVDRLLRIWQQVEGKGSRWRLTIIGSGKEEKHLRQLTQKLNLQNVVFEGQQSDVTPFYDRASIIAMTSSFEGWPMSIAEAQIRGVIPILFSSFAGAHDLISSAEEGILIPPYQEDTFANELLKLQTDPRRRIVMQANVIRKAQTYTIERTVSAWIKMLEKLS